MSINERLEIKKKLQISANFYLEILEVLQKLESQGFLNILINDLKKIYEAEQESLINGILLLFIKNK